MKTESNIKPDNFQIENMSNNKCDIILNENIEEIEVSEDEEKRYSYDTYRLTNVRYREELEESLKDSNEYQKWLEKAKSNEYDELAKEVREKRDTLLAETDWTQMSDTALSEEEQEKYKKYRQALRDVPAQENFPYDVEFPTLEVE